MLIVTGLLKWLSRYWTTALSEATNPAGKVPTAWSKMRLIFIPDGPVQRMWSLESASGRLHSFAVESCQRDALTCRFRDRVGNRIRVRVNGFTAGRSDSLNLAARSHANSKDTSNPMILVPL